MTDKTENTTPSATTTGKAPGVSANDTQNRAAGGSEQGLVPSLAERMLPMIMEGMARLNPDERRRLDALIGPEAVFLMTKAYGPEIGALLWPHAVLDAAASA